MDYKKKLGERIRTLRTSKHIKQKELAQSIGKAASYLCDIEKGRTLPSLKILFEMSNVLKVGLVDFFIEEKEGRKRA